MRRMSCSCAYRTMRRVRPCYGSKIPILLCSTRPPRTGRRPAGATASRSFLPCRRQDCGRQSVLPSRLPCQRLYCAGLSARFRRTACTGCASELLFADRLFRRRQKDDAEYRAPERSFLLNAPRQYALGQTHKHLKEMKAVTGLASEPVFCPVVADFYSGMQVTVPLFASWLAPGAGMEEVKNAYKASIPARSSPIRTRRMRAASCPLPHSPVWTA